MSSSSSSSGASDSCYYRNGTLATNDTPCPGSEMCCPTGDTCMDNGLCRDKNNHPDGALTTFSDGDTYNYTGLYYTPSCLNETYNDCPIQCTTYTSDGGDYIWACNDALTSYCCHQDSDALASGDCCSRGTFSLASPVALSQTASATSTTSSTTAATTTSTTTPTTTSTTTSQLSSATGNSSSPSNTSLSSGAEAGIGVGVAAAAVIIIVLAVLWYRANRRARLLGGAVGAGKVEASQPHVKQELDAAPAQSFAELEASEPRLVEI